MEASYGTPLQLIEGLQARQPQARALLWQLLREPTQRLMHDLTRRHELQDDPALLTAHALHAVETAFRARPASAFSQTGWNAFRAAALLQIARLANAPHASATAPPGVPPLPDAPDYHSDTFFRPYSRLGDHFFGGDWYAGRTLADGSLWVFVADVTGHGYFAYLLASALPAVWQHCWNRQPTHSPQPAEVLAVMHDQLADSLPDGIFLECTLVRLDATGQTTVSAAGATRLLLRRNARPTELLKLRGAWLGLAAPTAAEQHTIHLREGDELILTTDGVFDQLEDDGGPEAVARGLNGAGAVFDTLRERLTRSLESGPQKDDITLVLLRRREAEGDPVVLRFGPRRGDDVPV